MRYLARTCHRVGYTRRDRVFSSTVFGVQAWVANANICPGGVGKTDKTTAAPR
jgi:hypothetical protein